MSHRNYNGSPFCLFTALTSRSQGGGSITSTGEYRSMRMKTGSKHRRHRIASGFVDTLQASPRRKALAQRTAYS